MRKTIWISDSPQGGSENFQTADKLLLNALSVDLQTRKIRVLINPNLDHYDKSFRGGQWTGFQITSDTHDLIITPGDAPQKITIDGTNYEISVHDVCERLSKGGQYRYAELEISW